MLTGLAGDAFPSQIRALSGSAYPAFSLQGRIAEPAASRSRGAVQGVRVFDPRYGSKTVGVSTGGLPVVTPADGCRNRSNRAPRFMSSGCPQRTWLWSGVGTSASSGRPIGRHGDRAKRTTKRRGTRLD